MGLLHRPMLIFRLIKTVVCPLITVQSYLWTLVRSLFKQPDSLTSYVQSKFGQRVHVSSLGRRDHVNPYWASVRMRFWIKVAPA